MMGRLACCSTVLLVIVCQARAEDYDRVARHLDDRRAVIHAPAGATVYRLGPDTVAGATRR